MDNKNIDLLLFAKKIYRYKISILLILLSTLITTYFYIKKTVPIYKSSIVIDVGKNSKSELKSLFPENQRVTVDMDNKLDYDIAILKSRYNIKSIIDVIKFYQRTYISNGWTKKELYKEENPFFIKFKYKNIKDITYNFTIVPINRSGFYFYENGNKSNKKVYSYGEEIKRDNFSFSIDLAHKDLAKGGQEYFIELDTNKEHFISKILSNLTITKEAKPLLRISYEDNNPIRAKDVVEELVKSYRKFIAKRSQYQDREQVKIFDKKIKLMAKKLQLITKKIREYKEKHPELLFSKVEDSIILNVMDNKSSLSKLSLELNMVNNLIRALDKNEYASIFLDGDQSYNSEIRTLLDTLHSKEEYLALLERQSQNLDVQLFSDENYNSMINEKRKIGKELYSLSFQYTDEYYLVKELKDNLNTIDNRMRDYLQENILNIRKEISQIKNNLKKSLKVLKQSLKSQLKVKRQSLKDKKNIIQKLPYSLSKLKKLESEFTTNENSYKSLLKKRVEISISMNTTVDIPIVEGATVPSAPIKPKKAFLYLSSLILGLILSVLYASLRMRADRKIYSEDEIALTNKTIFHFDKEGTKRDSLWLLISFLEKRRTLKDSALKILISSNSIIENRVPVIEQIALGIKNIEKKVLIINYNYVDVVEANRVFNIDSDSGLSTILTSKQPIENIELNNYIHHISSNIDILPSGPIVHNSPKLLFSPKIETLLNRLSMQYDYIFLDAPPLGEYPISDILIQYVDLVAIVIKLKKSSSEIIEKLNSIDERNIEKIVCII